MKLKMTAGKQKKEERNGIRTQENIEDKRRLEEKENWRKMEGGRSR